MIRRHLSYERGKEREREKGEKMCVVCRNKLG